MTIKMNPVRAAILVGILGALGAIIAALIANRPCPEIATRKLTIISHQASDTTGHWIGKWNYVRVGFQDSQGKKRNWELAYPTGGAPIRTSPTPTGPVEVYEVPMSDADELSIEAWNAFFPDYNAESGATRIDLFKGTVKAKDLLGGGKTIVLTPAPRTDQPANEVYIKIQAKLD